MKLKTSLEFLIGKAHMGNPEERSEELTELLTFGARLEELAEREKFSGSFIIFQDNCPPLAIVFTIGDDTVTGSGHVCMDNYALLMAPGNMEKLVRWFENLSNANCEPLDFKSA